MSWARIKTRPKERCAGTKDNGKPCRYFASPGDTMCIWHSTKPGADERRAFFHLVTSSKGGHARAASQSRKKILAQVKFPAAPLTIQDCKRNLAWIADHVLREKILPQTANAAIRALQLWVVGEDYDGKIRALTKQVEQLLRVEAKKSKAR
jgi:hypothetical protein